MPSVSNPLELLSLPRLRERTSVKWRVHPADVLPLWVAEMDVPLAEPIADALHRAIDRGDTGYPIGRGYARAVGAFAAERWGWDDFPVERTSLVPDVMMGIVEVLRRVTRPGDTVIVSPPVYPPFYAFVSHDARKVAEAPLSPAGRLDFNTLEERFRDVGEGGGRGAYLLCNPHNPTGAVHTREELEELARLARDHGIRVVADEIHAPLVLPGAIFTPYLAVAGAEDAFSLVSASKGWNLAGLKCALAVAGEEAAEELAAIPEEVGHGPSHLGVIAHTAAFEEGGPWLDALLEGLDENRALLERLLAEHLPEMGYLRPEGTYLAWLDARPLGIDRDATPDGPGLTGGIAGPARFFLEEARVALSSGHVFGTGGAGHVRLNHATSRANLTEAIERMAAAVARHR